LIDWLDGNFDVIFDGLYLGSLLFVLSAGLSLIFGAMNILNLAHGALYLIGAYVAWRLTGSVATWTELVAALVIAIVLGLLAGAFLALMVRPVEGRGHLDEALLTLGIGLVIAQGLVLVFGPEDHLLDVPSALDGNVELLGHAVPAVRVAVIAISLALAAALWLVLERTRAGALIRATVADRDMVAALGVDTRRVVMMVFAAAGGLAALAGVLGGTTFTASPEIDTEVLLLSLVVVVIGGLGSIKGALIAALVVGQVDAIGRVENPDLPPFLLLGVMALVLLFRPEGLFGKPPAGTA
jgi:branched-chain amino acid transport system permease protein